MKQSFYELCKQNLYNKDKYIKNYIDYMFTKVNELFIYKNMPDNIDIKKMEYFIQKNGFVFFIKKDNEYNFFIGNMFEYDVYDTPKKINITTRDNKVMTYKLDGTQGVIIGNDFLNKGLTDLFTKYGVMLNECEITLYMNAVLSRIPYVMSASDDDTKKNADIFIDKIYKGDFSIIGSNQFFDGVDVKGVTSQQNHTQQNIELTQYIKASAFNEIGLNSNFNMKRERLNTSEINLNENAIKPYIENMFNTRKLAIEKINKLYGLNIEIELCTLWDNFTLEDDKPVEDDKPIEDVKPIEDDKAVNNDIR